MNVKVRVTCMNCKNSFELSASHFNSGACACPCCKAQVPDAYDMALHTMFDAAAKLPDIPYGWEGDVRFVFAQTTGDLSDGLLSAPSEGSDDCRDDRPQDQ